jgi:hypothetical protein
MGDAHGKMAACPILPNWYMPSSYPEQVILWIGQQYEKGRYMPRLMANGIVLCPGVGVG